MAKQSSNTTSQNSVKPTKVLLLEDEFLLRKNIAKYLRMRGYEVIECEDGNQVLDKEDLFDYDAFILDIDVPGFNGFEIAHYLGEKKISAPIVFTSALTNIKDVAKGFELGASDYIKKPFDLLELEIRISKLLQIYNKSNVVHLTKNVHYDLVRRELFYNSGSIKLSRIQSKLIYILVKNSGKIVGFEEIIEYVWGGNENVAQNTVISHIRGIRKIVPEDFIKNSRGEGYYVS